MQKFIKNLKKELKKLFEIENTGHDYSHLERVFNNALKIQEAEGGDLYVVAVAALVHDIHRLMAVKLGHYVEPEDSVDYAKEILLECGVDLNKLDQILDIVKNHDNKKDKNFPLETLIIQDADELDAIGEIGIKRTLKYCKTHNIPTSANVPLDCEEYIPDLNPISTCHYVYRTMIPNAKKLYTKTAKKLAENKIKILEDFIKKNYNTNWFRRSKWNRQFYFQMWLETYMTRQMTALLMQI